MYGMDYGYRSSLNESMIRHLEAKAQLLQDLTDLGPGDNVIDIGSNDATMLSKYSINGLNLIGVDPVGTKYKENYEKRGIRLIPDFFSEETMVEHGFAEKAKLITSIAMFYDLPNPHKFVGDIKVLLADDGI